MQGTMLGTLAKAFTAISAALLLAAFMSLGTTGVALAQAKPKAAKKCVDYRAACFKRCLAASGRSCQVLCNSRPTC